MFLKKGGISRRGDKKRRDADTPFRTLCLGILRDEVIKYCIIVVKSISKYVIKMANFSCE